MSANTWKHLTYYLPCLNHIATTKTTIGTVQSFHGLGAHQIVSLHRTLGTPFNMVCPILYPLELHAVVVCRTKPLSFYNTRTFHKCSEPIHVPG